MAWIRFILTTVLTVSGLVVLCIGVFGVFRFNYSANRMHAAAINDTLGAGLMLVGLAISSPDLFSALKILLVLLLLWLTSPVASHLLLKLEIETNEERQEYMNIDKDVKHQ